MFCHKRAGISRSKGLVCRVRNYFLAGHKHTCNALTMASAQVDTVATVPKPKSVRITSRPQASSTGADELGLHPNSEVSPSTPGATTTGRASLRPWSFADAPIGPKGTIFGWRTECPKSVAYAAAGVIPFAYREDEQELYVLMSFQRSERDPNIPLVYTFLGGKVADGDKKDPCRTAAREAYEETHRVLDEQLVLDALLGKVPAYGSQSSVYGSLWPQRGASAGSPASGTPASAAACEVVSTGAAANGRADAAGNAAAAAVIGNTGAAGTDPTGSLAGDGALGSSPTASSSCSSTRSTTGTRSTTETGCNSSSSSGRGRSEDSNDYSSGRGGGGRYPVPSAYFPSGRYTAFAMHVPNAWHLPELCQERIKDKQKHPQAKKAEGLAWVSLRQLALMRGGESVNDDVSGRMGSGHHYVLMLMRAKRGGDQPVGVFKWLQSLEAHLQDWHRLPETDGQQHYHQQLVTKAATSADEEGEEEGAVVRALGRGSESEERRGGEEDNLNLVAVAEKEEELKPQVVPKTKANAGKDLQHQQHQYQQAFYTVWATDGSSQQVVLKQAPSKPPPSLLRLQSGATASAVAAVVRGPPSGLAQSPALPPPLPRPPPVPAHSGAPRQPGGESSPIDSGDGSCRGGSGGGDGPTGQVSSAGSQQPHGHPHSQPQQIQIQGQSVQQPQQQPLRQEQQAAHEWAHDQGKPYSKSDLEATFTPPQPQQTAPSSTSGRSDRSSVGLLQQRLTPSQQTTQPMPSPQELLARPQQQQGHQGHRQWKPQQPWQRQVQSRVAAGGPWKPSGPQGFSESFGGKPPTSSPLRGTAPADGDAASIASAAAPDASSSLREAVASPLSPASIRVEEPRVNTTCTAQVQEQPRSPPRQTQQEQQHPGSSVHQPQYRGAYRKWYMDGRVETVVEGLGSTESISVLSYRLPAQLPPPSP